MASSKQPNLKIPNNRLRGRLLGIVLSGGSEAWPVLKLFSRLEADTEVNIRCWVDQDTLRYTTQDYFQQFGKTSTFETGSVHSIGARSSFQSADVRLILDFSKQHSLSNFANALKRSEKQSFLYVAPEISEAHQTLENLEFAGTWSPVLEYIATKCTPENRWTGKKVLVTAGPTQEDIDPIRYITNRSSGKMGFALARQAAIHGAKVTLITGPVSLDTPYGVDRADVRTADEMLEAALNFFNDADIVYAAAAVEDLKPINVAKNKLKKQSTIRIECEPAVDVLASLASKKTDQFLVGFSVETENVAQNSKAKLKRKSLDMIVANNPREAGAAFRHETNKATVFTSAGEAHSLPLMPKDELAIRLLELSAEAMQDHAG
ncbi:MAG: Coenzyme A biosynthesis bifunctional protein CoaBC [Candidatus Marinimicrobia bacterium]|nr:Coenzyme A biosynthesis bifunctional protein CoaBC [Candidatus Neomarinimicrobiota bacterium]